MITLTDLEFKLMDVIAHCEMNTTNGATPESAADVDTYLWADERAASLGVTEQAVGGLLTLLATKGAIEIVAPNCKMTEGNANNRGGSDNLDPDGVVCFTEAGFEAWRAGRPEPTPNKAKRAAGPKPKKDEPFHPKRVVHTVREEWLNAAVVALDEEFFKENGYELPEKLRISCGFPRGQAKAIGQCWDPTVSADGTTHMFVCPSLGADVIVVLQVILHEMIHASVGLKVGHKGAFRKLAKEFGMAGKMTATYAEVEGELWHALRTLGYRLGSYPHAPMRKPTKAAGPRDWTRLHSVHDHKYNVVINNSQLDEHGAPVDPWGDVMVAA